MRFPLVFFGTSSFAVPSLEALISNGRFEIRGVITQPDRPVGRHAEITPPPIKVVADKYGLTVIQPEKIKDLPKNPDFKAAIEPRPTAFVVASYGKILPQWLLDIPEKGCINVHASLLPRWRGASPIQAAIAVKDKVTGITIMLMDALLDHGPILAQIKEPILDTDTSGSLHDKLSEHGADILPNVLADYLEGKIKPREQDHALATECRILTRDDGKIEWNESADKIERLIRAYNPWPGTWTELEGKRLKILEARIRPNCDSCRPGEFFLWKNKPNIACNHGTVLELVAVQPEGKKPMSGEEFVKGYRNL